MKILHKLLLTTLCRLMAVGTSFAQTPAETHGAVGNETVVTFKFVPGQDMFYIPWSGNDAELNRLYALVDEYRADITAGRIPVYVDGYCASLCTLPNAYVVEGGWYKKHYRGKHGENEFASGHNHINDIENFWDVYKVRLSKFRGMHKQTFIYISERV